VKTTDPTVSFDGLHECRERVGLEHDSVRMIRDEVQVLQCRTGLGTLPARRTTLVGAALQIVLLMITDRRRQKVVHDHKPNVLPTTLQINAAYTQLPSMGLRS